MQHPPPVFPPELFNIVINELAEEAKFETLIDDLKYRDGGSPHGSHRWYDSAERALQSCSRVSKEMMMMSRPHLFHRVDVILGDEFDFGALLGTRSSRERYYNRLCRLISVLKASPQLMGYVRELVLSVNEDLQEKVLPRSHAEVLLNFPSLSTIVILKCIPKTLPNFCQTLFDTYLPRDTFTCLDLADFNSPIPFATIAGASNLQTLKLKECDIEAFTGPSFQTVKHLEVLAKCSQLRFPLSFLSHFPSLLSLSIDENYNATPSTLFEPGTSDNRCPSTQLETLRLDTGSLEDGISRLLDFFGVHARQHGEKAFDKLKTLWISLADDEDLQSLKTLLEDGPHLQSLIITDALYGLDRGPQIQNFILHDVLACSFPTLRSLSLSIPPFYDSATNHGSWSIAITNMESLLSSMASQNVIEYMSLMIKVILEDQLTDLPSARDWSRVSAILSSVSNFPHFKKFYMSIDIVVDDYMYEPETPLTQCKSGPTLMFKTELWECFEPVLRRIGRPEFQLYLDVSRMGAYDELSNSSY